MVERKACKKVKLSGLLTCDHSKNSQPWLKRSENTNLKMATRG